MENNNQVAVNSVASEQNNNGYKKIALILLIVGLLLFGIAGYKILTEKKDNPPSEDNQDANTIVGIELSQVSVRPFKIDEMQKEKMELLKGEKDFEMANNFVIKASFNGNKAIISYNKDGNINKEFDNVSKVFYISYGQCMPAIAIYIISGDSIYMVDAIDVDVTIEELQEVNNASKYVDIYRGILHPRSCGYTPIWLGYTSDGKYYDLKTNTEYIHDSYYYYNDINNYIKNDMTYKFESNTGKVKAFFIDDNEDELVAFIDDNNNLYKLDYEKGGYKLESTQKVTKIDKRKGSDSDMVYVIFADGTKSELGAYDLIKLYK